VLYVDYVVSQAIDILEQSKVPYVFIFLPDHGESLLEEGRVFHGMPPGVDLPYEQAHIPLIVKSSIPIEVLAKEEYKQQDVYDTVLDLLSIDINLLNDEKVFIKKSQLFSFFSLSCFLLFSNFYKIYPSRYGYS